MLRFKYTVFGCLFLCNTTFIFSKGLDGNFSKEENITTNYDALSALGDIFEPMFSTHSTNITDIITTFGIIFGMIVSILVIASAIKMYKIDEGVSKNQNDIHTLKSEITERVNDMYHTTQISIDEFEKLLFDQRLKINEQRERDIEKLEHEVHNQVQGEIINSASELLEKVQDHAYRLLASKMEEMKQEVEKRLFNYQKMVYSINMLKKLEYDKVFRENVDANEKLKMMSNIQSKYNETNNITIPKLLSNNIENDVVGALKKLSDREELKDIIIEFFRKSFEVGDYKNLDASIIKYTLVSFYGYDYDKEKKEDEVRV